MSGVCGIQLEAGSLTLRPYPHPSLGHAEAKWLSPVGEIRSGWRYAGHRLHFEFTVPSPAEIILPDGEKHRVKAGTYSYDVSP
jgi:alpha-L-rhamnosidase